MHNIPAQVTAGESSGWTHGLLFTALEKDEVFGKALNLKASSKVQRDLGADGCTNLLPEWSFSTKAVPLQAMPANAMACEADGSR